MRARTIRIRKAAKAIAEACNVNIVEAQDLVPVFVRKVA